MPGPPPTPTETLKARGSWRAKARQGEPASDGQRPDCPGVLKGEAKREWTRVMAQLERLGILDQIDRGLVAGYCMAWSKLHRAEGRATVLEDECDRLEAKIQETEDDAESKNLLAQLERTDKQIWKTEVSWGRAYNAFIKAADRLGVGAAARARVKAEPKDEVDPLEELMKRNRRRA